MEREHMEFYRELVGKLVEQGVVQGGLAEKARVLGVIDYRLFGPDGEVRQAGRNFNLVTSIGDMYLAHLLANSIVGNPGSMWAELGVGTAAPAKADIAVTSAIATSSLAVSNGYPVRVASFGTGAGEWTQWRYSWGAGVTTNGSIGEVGMRTQAGSFVAHAIVAPNVNKTANDTLQIDWSWKFLGA